ncbi:uncharacterized protein METZ01_LOCUS364609, partial [marine metagenome]
VSSNLIQSIRAQSKLSISHAISLIENQGDTGSQLLSSLFKYTGNAYRIGITGPPGVGKSSLTDNLISAFRKEDKRVAVIAVDPTSPFTGGAVLGDRIRMATHHSDPHVFVRSMATRGGQGGLSARTEEVGEIFDAAQFDIIIYETVGVGQIELDIIQVADSVIVVLVPESGDEVQMMKAGLMEIGNVFAINKADTTGANKLMITLKNILSTFTYDDIWHPEVIQTIATEGKGTDDLLKSIHSHQAFNKSQGIQRQKFEDRYQRRVNAHINVEFQQKFWDETKKNLLKSELQK